MVNDVESGATPASVGSVSFPRGFPAARAPLREAEWRSTESSDDTFPVESSEDQEDGLIAILGCPRSSIVTLSAVDKMNFSLTTGEALTTIPKVTITVGIVSENQKRKWTWHVITIDG